MIWPVYVLLLLESCFLIERISIKIHRRLFRRHVAQETLLVLAWVLTIPTAVLAIFVLGDSRDDKAAMYLLIAHYLAIFIAHLTKASLALLFISFARLQEYKLINQCILPIIGLSATLSMVAISLQCSFKGNSDSGGPEQCHFEGVAMVESLFNILLGLMLVLHPIKPLFRAYSVSGKPDVAMLSCLFGTALATFLVSIMRAVLSHHDSKHAQSYTGSDNDPEQMVELLSRVRLLALLLFVEAALGIMLAAIPDMAGLYMQYHEQRMINPPEPAKKVLPDAPNARPSRFKIIRRPPRPDSMESIFQRQNTATREQRQRMDQFMWGFNASPDRWNKMPSLHHLPLHSTGRMPKGPLAKLPSTLLPACTHSNTLPASGD